MKTLKSLKISRMIKRLIKMAKIKMMMGKKIIKRTSTRKS